MQRWTRQLSGTVAFVLCAGTGMGCGGGSNTGPNIVQGATYGGSVHLEIDDGGGSGVETSHVPATLITVLASVPSSGAAQMFVGGYADEGNGFSAKQWQIMFTVASAPVTGGSYTIVSQASNPPPATDAALSFEEESPYTSWVGQSGSVTVESVVGTTATFNVAAVDMAASGGAASGPFSFSGQIVIDLSNLCQCTD